MNSLTILVDDHLRFKIREKWLRNAAACEQDDIERERLCNLKIDSLHARTDGHLSFESSKLHAWAQHEYGTSLLDAIDWDAYQEDGESLIGDILLALLIEHDTFVAKLTAVVEPRRGHMTGYERNGFLVCSHVRFSIETGVVELKVEGVDHWIPASDLVDDQNNIRYLVGELVFVMTCEQSCA